MFAISQNSQESIFTTCTEINIWKKVKIAKIQRREITFNIQCKSYIAFIIITDKYDGVSGAQLRPD